MASQQKPTAGRPRLYESAAQAQAAYRARKGKALQIYLPPELVADLDEHIEAKQLRDRSEVIAAALKRHLREAKRNR